MRFNTGIMLLASCSCPLAFAAQAPNENPQTHVIIAGATPAANDLLGASNHAAGLQLFSHDIAIGASPPDIPAANDDHVRVHSFNDDLGGGNDTDPITVMTIFGGADNGQTRRGAPLHGDTADPVYAIAA